MNPATVERVARARAHARRGESLQAELTYVDALRHDPGCAEAARAVAQFAGLREDWARAIAHLELARKAEPGRDEDLHWLSDLLRRSGRASEAVTLLHQQLRLKPQDGVAWLCLAALREEAGDPMGAARARFQGITRMQKRGVWLNERTTEPHLLPLVRHSTERLRAERREYLMQSLETQRATHGPAALKRVEYAVLAYLREVDAGPADPRQRPTFFYFPGLPDLPYHDPYLQPWAARLQAAWRDMRAEAVQLLVEEAPLEDFLGLKPGDARNANYVGGDGPAPAWDAYFFYRHGERYDDNHARCPITSSVLESIDLCRIDRQTPEVCFSVLRPGSTIQAHHGVTNTRLVMHVPLIVPADCALNLIDAGEHHWVEGELVMFDDTYKHEAWNRSSQTRVIVLMDCWNPHLAPVERAAVKALVEAIGRFEQVPALD